jgi:nitroreductase
MSEVIDFLLERRSALSKDIKAPGPGDEQLETILKIASRVPDHGKLAPWRFIVIRGDARMAFGQVLASAYENAVAEPDESRKRAEAQRFAMAPVIVAVVSREVIHIKIPHWEQILSTGAVCQNLLLAANALGFAAQWTSDWLAYDDQVLAALGLVEGEKIAGFVYLGSTDEKLEDRRRPALEDIVTYWSGDEA